MNTDPFLNSVFSSYVAPSTAPPPTSFTNVGSYTTVLIAEGADAFSADPNLTGLLPGTSDAFSVNPDMTHLIAVVTDAFDCDASLTTLVS